MAGCNRFGIDNPAPTITKRIALYGNAEDVEKMINAVAQATKAIDSEAYAGIEQLKKAHSVLEQENYIKKKQKYLLDMKETKVSEPQQKSVGVPSLRMVQTLESKKNWQAPEAILSKGVTIKIQDLKEIAKDNEIQMKSKLTNFQIAMHEKGIVIPSFGTTTALLAKHFNILRNLKRRIFLL